MKNLETIIANHRKAVSTKETALSALNYQSQQTGALLSIAEALNVMNEIAIYDREKDS